MSARPLLPRAAAVLAGSVALAVLPGTPAQATVSSTPDGGTPSFDGPVLVVRTVGDLTYVGGAFTQATDSYGTKARSGAAAFRTSTGKLVKWNPKVAGEVRDIAVAGRSAYLAGQFTSVRGQARSHFARVKATKGGKVQPGTWKFNDAVNAVEVSGKTVFAGGEFTRVGKKDRTRLAAFSRRGKLRAFAPLVQSGGVNDLRATKAGLYVAGEFNSLNGETRDGHLALVKKRNGRTVRAFDPAIEREVLDIEVRKVVYAAVGGAGGGAAWKLNRKTGGTGWRQQFDGDVQAVTVLAREVYFGGHFRNLCSTDRTDFGTGDCLDGDTERRGGASFQPNGTLTGWDPQINSQEGIVSMATSASTLLAGGHFTTSRGDSALRVAAYGQ